MTDKQKEREYRESMNIWDKARLADALGGLCIKCQISDVNEGRFYCARCCTKYSTLMKENCIVKGSTR